MSEPKPEYLTDAEEMIGTGYDQPAVVIEPPRTTTARHNGRMVEVEEPAWVKFSTDFKQEIGLFDVYALKVFIYVGLSINWQSGEAFPGVRKIAEDAKMDKGTVIQAVQWLEANNYMTVFRQDGKPNTYKPLRYFSIGTVRPDRTPSEEVSGENEEVSGEPRVNLHNKNNKIKQELSPADLEQANRKFNAILENERVSRAKQEQGVWEGRELIPNHLLPYADWWNATTGQAMKGKSNTAWLKTFTEWHTERLLLATLDEAYEMEKAWKVVIAKPHELTAKAVAIQALPKVSNTIQPVTVDEQGIPESY